MAVSTGCSPRAEWPQAAPFGHAQHTRVHIHMPPYSQPTASPKFGLVIAALHKHWAKSNLEQSRAGKLKSSKEMTLASRRDSPAASVPASKAAPQVQMHMTHRVKHQRWPWGTR